MLGEMRLDAIKMHAIEILKADLLARGLSRKRVNNILACLGKMLRVAGNSGKIGCEIFDSPDNTLLGAT